ncbi:MAG TPA: tRNA (adenosine(37)-N6)-threonylcarbamoyltransferase complex dimerization subunit type 1 TsaB [Thermoleophilaceae bacterium]|nr:tRNA (adenosine(37)-N6)-threonylcarbamoyltransferase complex dimerization subunit type 1 TsaB [Thermoleophilaceae bacterium]
MNVLGLDTSTAATAVCLLRADGESFEVVPDPSDLFSRPAHARELMPALVRVLDHGGLGFPDLDAVAVGRGPGTFTGLRIGIATARAIASARSLPVHSVSSLAALAAGAEGEGAAAGASVLAAIDARRGEVFAALFHPGGRELWAPWVAAPEGVAGRVREGGVTPLAVGDGAVRFRAELESAGARVPADDDARHAVRGLHVCRFAARVAPSAPEAIVPDYLRQPDAVPQTPRRPR